MIFWLKKWTFEISEVIFDSFWHPNFEKRPSRASLKVSKKIFRPLIENRLDAFVQNDLRINLILLTWSYDQNWHRETLKTEKKQKLVRECPFEIIGFMCWPKLAKSWKSLFQESTYFWPKTLYMRMIFKLKCFDD